MGTLYLCSTPIGNLEDITLRALRMLKEVDLIAAENTRQTQKLLTHFGIRKPLVSYYDTGNSEAKEKKLIEKLQSGSAIALVSSAGTPVLCDPGYKLVKKCLQEKIRVIPLPGPAAAVAALTASGLPPHPFFFGGFLPAKKQARQNFLRSLSHLSYTLIFYETPHRIAESLVDCLEVLGDRKAVIARELTKIHEEMVRGNLADLVPLAESKKRSRGQSTKGYLWKGEITLLIAGNDKQGALLRQDDRQPELEKEIRSLVDKGVSTSEAVRQIAQRHGIPKRKLYALAHHRFS